MNAHAPSRPDRLRIYVAAFTMDMAVVTAGLAVVFFAVNAGLSADKVGYIGAAGAVAYTASCFVSRTLSDRWGRKVIAGLALALVVACYLGQAAAGALWAIVGLGVLAAASMAMFWPTMLAWLAEVAEPDSRGQGRSFSAFNICWSAGMMAGPVLCGYLYRNAGWQFPFLAAALATTVCLLVVLSVRAPRPERTEPRPTPAVSRRPDATARFLRMAWYANFASWFVGATIRVLFPKVGHELGYTEDLIGWLIAGMSFGQVLTFIGLRFTTRWQYRLAPLLAAQLVSAGGMVAAVCFASPVLFATAFTLAGIGGGVSYSCSLFYSLHGRQRDRAATTGLHEGIIGAGGILGPLLGGWAARFIGLRAPFGLAALVVVVAVALQLREWQIVRRMTASETDEEPCLPRGEQCADSAASPGGTE